MEFSSRSLLLSTCLLLLAFQQMYAQSSAIFENGQAQTLDSFSNSEDWIREELWVQTEFDSDNDGKLDRMHTSVIRQKQTETESLKVPVIYITSPYYSGGNGGLENFWNVNHEIGETPPARISPEKSPLASRPYISSSYSNQWVPRGFAMVYSESPGTGLSEGCPTVGGQNESLAPKAVIDWLNGRAKAYTTVDGDELVTAEWCTGNVGMMGTSYNGTLPLAAATTGVDGLKAIIPDSPNTSYWHYYRANGLVRNPGGYQGEDIDVLYEYIHSQESDLRSYCDKTIRDTEYAENMDRITGDYNEFWSSRDYTNQLDNVKAAVFFSHGLSDWNVMPDHSVRIYDALKAKGNTVKMYLHQGGHGGMPPFEMMNRWFSRYLYDIENGIENEDRLLVVREGANRNEPSSYPDYPNPEATMVDLYMNGNGNEIANLSLEKTDGQGVQTIEDNVSFDAESLANAEITDHRLLFVTSELKEDIHISGRPVVSIKAASSKEAVNLSVYLISLPWTKGRYRKGGLITRGWADLQNHDSMSESEALVPGKFYEMSFTLEPDDQIIEKGQKLALMIFSSDKGFTLHPKPGTLLEVDIDQSNIKIPVVGGKEALSKAIE